MPFDQKRIPSHLIKIVREESELEDLLLDKEMVLKLFIPEKNLKYAFENKEKSLMDYTGRPRIEWFFEREMNREVGQEVGLRYAIFFGKNNGYSAFETHLERHILICTNIRGFLQFAASSKEELLSFSRTFIKKRSESEGSSQRDF